MANPLAAFAKTLLSAAVLMTAGCAIQTADDISAYPELRRAMDELQQEQKRFTAATTLPKNFHFPGNGRVIVRQIALEGYPGNTYVKARWTYQNDTGRPVLRALVGLDVLDPEGRLVASKVSVCIFPSPRPIYDGTYYSDELRTQTHDVHVQPGWSWRITCKAEYVEDYFGDDQKEEPAAEIR